MDVAPKLTKTFSRDVASQLGRPMTAAADKAGQASGQRFGAQFGKGVGAQEKPLKRVSGVVKGLGGDFLDMRTATAAAGVAAFAFYKDSIRAASDLTETQSKVRVVFGGSATDILAWGKGAASAMGLSERAAEEAAGTFGNLFVSMKIGQRPAADMSKRLVGLAADLASFNNVDPTETLDALRSGLVGETEPLRRFGVNLNDAALRQEALRLGLVRTTKQVLPPAAKAQAAYSLILAQTATAQGDYARTSDSLANTQRTLAANIENLKASLGKGLAPALAEVTGLVSVGATAFAKLNDATDNAVTTFALFGPIIGSLAGAWHELNKIIHAGAEETEQSNAVGAAAAQIATQLGTAHADATPKIKGTAVAVEGTAVALESYRIALHANNEKLAEAIPLFEGYRRESDVTAGAIVRNLRREVGAYGTWADDTQTLIKRGADPQFIQELSAKGPQYVHALATASDKELALAQKFFRQRMGEIRNLSKTQLAAAGREAPAGFAAQMRGQAPVVGAASRTLASSATGPLRSIRDDARTWGQGLGLNFGSGISSRSSLEQARKASRVLGASVTTLLKFSAGPRQGPLAEGGGPYVWGQHFAERYAAGMASKYGLLSATAGGLGGGMRGSVQAIVHRIAAARGWGAGAQWAALGQLISHESGWNPRAQNPTSTAYGLFQFLNSTWAGTGIRKTSDPGLQTVAGLRYIAGRHGSPLGAWNFWRAHHWYGSGLPPTLFDRPTVIGVGERGPETVSVTPGRSAMRLHPADLRALGGAVAAALTGAPLRLHSAGGVELARVVRDGTRRLDR